MVMISTYWVLQNAVHDSLMKQYTNVLSADGAGQRAKIPLNKFLAKSEGIYSFMTHLCHEFSPENMLFIYEANQFKKNCGVELDEVKCVKKQNKKDTPYEALIPQMFEEEKDEEFSGDLIRRLKQKSDAQNSGEDSSIIILPDDLPKSDIVHSEAFSIQEKFKLLTDKYILHNAEFQINIPYSTMDKIYVQYQIANSLVNEE
eukprot:UN06741